ncbi:Crp/Fnr family transcriptional regulator [Collinsella sp. An2]|uniref:Crp/Fnr family transcriptional regulator n=1 Tax=Collinsella sp. An2 TaxID=1965585 RepID=UPI000B37A9FC|nr:Crp/Fnr family transcriptional regulator [Collinsella sp. An2]OUP07998.1 cAMP-binding protein [Collinsella sp. An2]
MDNQPLYHSKLFRGMSTQEVDAAAQALHVRRHTFEKGEMILRAGDTTDRLFLVSAGSVTIENTDVWGNRSILNIVGAGGFFAETYAVLSHEPLLVDVVASERCELISLRIGVLVGEMKQRDAAASRTAQAASWVGAFIYNLLEITAHKNLALSDRAFHTAPKTARARIMAYLNSVALTQHNRTFNIPFDRQQMADYLNLDRTALSKELGRMRHEGIIDFRKNHFELLTTASTSAHRL